MSGLRNLLLFMTILGAGMPAHAYRIGDYLEQFDLESLTLTSTHSERCGSKTLLSARILDPNGIGHTVRLGNYLGRNFGMITKIGKNQITVKEVFQGTSDEWHERTSTFDVMPDRAGKARAAFGSNLIHPEQCQRVRDIGELAEKLNKCFGIEKPSDRLMCYDSIIGR